VQTLKRSASINRSCMH